MTWHCPVCKDKRVLKFRGHQRGACADPASRNLPGGWREVPCLVCVIRSYETHHVVTAMKLAHPNAVGELPEVDVRFTYPHPRERSRK